MVCWTSCKESRCMWFSYKAQRTVNRRKKINLTVEIHEQGQNKYNAVIGHVGNGKEKCKLKFGEAIDMIRQILKFKKTGILLFTLVLILVIVLTRNRSRDILNDQLVADFKDVIYSEFHLPPKEGIEPQPKERFKMLKYIDSSNEDVKRELKEAKARIEQLETKIALLEGHVPQKYPDVKFLGYKERKRILVTGGAGFVGSHLVDVLMMQGHEVIVVDNFFTGRKRNVEHWFGHRNFELIHHDIVNPLYIEADEIYHLASPASPPHYMQNPVKTIKTNTLGTINMLGLARRVGAKILIASTSEVYGDPMVHPQPESYWGHVNPIGPRACYDEGKRVAETLAYAYAKQEKVTVRVARIFNTYGPRMHVSDGRVVSNFIMQALQNLTITVYGNGKQTRSFCYVSDLVDGLLALMKSNYNLPVNIGNPVEHTIEEFAMIIKNLVPGCRSTLSTGAAVEDDPQRRRPDITIAKNHLSWTPKVPLEEGLQKTIDYFREELSRTTFYNNQNYVDVKNQINM